MIAAEGAIPATRRMGAAPLNFFGIALIYYNTLPLTHFSGFAQTQNRANSVVISWINHFNATIAHLALVSSLAELRDDGDPSRSMAGKIRAGPQGHRTTDHKQEGRGFRVPFPGGPRARRSRSVVLLDSCAYKLSLYTRLIHAQMLPTVVRPQTVHNGRNTCHWVRVRK